jgi:hypothetical protein
MFHISKSGRAKRSEHQAPSGTQKVHKKLKQNHAGQNHKPKEIGGLKNAHGFCQHEATWRAESGGG